MVCKNWFSPGEHLTFCVHTVVGGLSVCMMESGYRLESFNLENSREQARNEVADSSACLRLASRQDRGFRGYLGSRGGSHPSCHRGDAAPEPTSTEVAFRRGTCRASARR